MSKGKKPEEETVLDAPDRRDEAVSADPEGDVAEAGPEAEAVGANDVGATEAPAEESDSADHTDGKAPDIEAQHQLLRDQHLRLAADFDNYKKRVESDLRLRWDRAQAELLRRLLEPLDDLQRVAGWEPDTTSVEAIVEGVDLVERKFLRVIEEVGVKMVDPTGEKFDPNTMEAMLSVPAETPEDDEMVAAVFQAGYTLKGELVRPARVSVFKAE